MKVSGSILLLLITFTATAQFSLFNEHNKVGLKDNEGRVLIPAQYESLGWSDGKFSIIDRVLGYKSNDKWGLINLDNRKIAKADYNGIVPGEGLYLIGYKNIKFSTRNAAGCINTSGKEIIPFQYDGLKISSFRVIAFVRSGNQFKFGLLDLNNRQLIPLSYKKIHSINSLRFAVENFENKTALFSETGKQITTFFTDSISNFSKNYAVIYENYHQGLIDRNGQIKIKPNYRAVQIQTDGTVVVRQLDAWVFLDGQNNTLKKLQADSLHAVGKELYELSIIGESKLVNAQFVPLGIQTFSSLKKFEKGKAIFKYQNKYGVINKNGLVVLKPKFDKLLYGENYYLNSQFINGKDQWSLLDTMGNQKHTKLYERIEAFNGKFYAVKKNNFWGALNENGKEIIACVHDSLLQNEFGNIVVKFQGQYGIIDIHENWIVAPQPNVIKLIDQNHYLEKSEHTVFLKSIDRNIIYFTDNKLEVYPDYLLEILPSGAIWKINFQGQIINRQARPDGIIETVFNESEGYRRIKKDGKFGFIDSRGRLRIANRYDDAQDFKEGLAAIKILGKWGFANLEDRIAIQPVYDYVSAFKNGLAVVKQKDLYGVVDKNGKLILQIRYQNITTLSSNRLLIKIDNLIGLADANGKIIINPKFDSIEDLDNGFIIVKRNGKYSLLNKQGVSIIPMVYDYLSFDSFNQCYLALIKSEWETLNVNE